MNENLNSILGYVNCPECMQSQNTQPSMWPAAPTWNTQQAPSWNTQPMPQAPSSPDSSLIPNSPMWQSPQSGSMANPLLPPSWQNTPPAPTNPALTQFPAQVAIMNNDNINYLNGFLRSQIGRKVTVEFLIGTNTLVDKSGTLLAVGINYIVINEIESDDVLTCDFYNIKFVKIYY